MDSARLNLSLVPLDIITTMLQYFCDEDRSVCALICKAWAKAAAAATRTIMMSSPTLQKFSSLQKWLENHGDHLVVLRLHGCSTAALTALPCAQLQDLLLHGGFQPGPGSNINIDMRVWSDIAAATKLTFVSLANVYTAFQQADVVSALTALQDLKQLSWHDVECSGEQQLSDSLLLQQLTNLTVLTLRTVSAAAFEHLRSLTKLQHLVVEAAQGWTAAGCPGLQELKTLTGLQLLRGLEDIPAAVCQLTVLQELFVWKATPTTLNSLQALTGLTQLVVYRIVGLSRESPPLQLPGLQQLMLCGQHMRLPLYLTGCTQLHELRLRLRTLKLSAPGSSLVASTMLQDLALDKCRLRAADGVAGGPVSWQQVFPGQLPHLTSLQLSRLQPDLQQGDVEHVVACCSSLQELYLTCLQDSFASALAQLSGLSRLKLEEAGDQQCAALTQLTGLRELTVDDPREVSAAGLQHLAALHQLISLGFRNTFEPSKISCVLQQHMSDTLYSWMLYYQHALVNQAPAGHPSDIPARLLRICDLAAAGNS